MAHPADNRVVPFFRLALFILLACAEIAVGDLQSQVQQIISKADLHKGYAGVCIIDTATGETLVAINADKSMIPASNQKLLTSGTALHILGPTFQFQTTLILSGKNLTIVGDGDPTIGDTELQGIKDWLTENAMLDRELDPWVQGVIESGTKVIETLLIDDRIFDRNFIQPSWPADQINNWYCAQVAGLNYHLNVVHFFPSPRKGTTAHLGEIAPRMKWMTFGNKTSSKTSKKDTSSFWVARPPNSNKMTARGNVKRTHTAPVKITFHDPAMIFGQILATRLRSKGIEVNKIARVEDDAPKTNGDVIFVHRTRLQTALRRSNTDSHNMYAEALLKRLAASVTNRPGTFDEGASAIQTAVTQRLGSHQKSLKPADGSGMSRDNRISPRTLARWLASFQIHEPAGKALVDSLATVGFGTLEKRFIKTDLGNGTVHAKSGYLLGVCTLSGYITFPDRAPLVFSILVNGVKGSVRGAKNMQEAIVSITATQKK